MNRRQFFPTLIGALLAPLALKLPAEERSEGLGF